MTRGRLLQLRALKLLVVEDNFGMREILRAVLWGLGARNITEARDYDAAIEAVSFIRYDLILLDCLLGDRTGLEIARELRETPNHVNQRAPMIMVSASADLSSILAARDAGIDEFVVKPMSVRTLADRISAAVFYRRRFIESETYAGPDRRRRADPLYRGPERREA